MIAKIWLLWLKIQNQIYNNKINDINYMDKNNLNKVNSTKSINYLSQSLAHSNVSQRWVTPGVWIVSQGLNLIKQYRELLEPWPFDRTEQTEEYVQLIDNLMVLSGKLSLLSEHRIDTRNVKEENEVYIKGKMEEYKNKDIVISLTEINLEIEWLDETNKHRWKITKNLESYMQGFVDSFVYMSLYNDDWESYETGFDLSPEDGLCFYDIHSMLWWLDQLWRYPVRTAQIQLMINHCIQIIVGICNILKNSIPPVEQRIQIYKKNPVRPGWRDDCLLEFCREMEYWMLEIERGGNQNRLIYNSKINDYLLERIWVEGLFNDLLTINISWEEREMDVHKRVPILSQSFDNIWDYFVNCQFDIFEWVMFANLPYNKTTHAIFKLRYSIKRLKSCIDAITELGGWNKHKIIVYAKLWCNVNNAKWAPYHLETKQMLEQPQFNNNVVLKDWNFKSLCNTYLKVIDDMQILMELYDQAREKRAKLLGIGHQIGYYSRNVNITEYPLVNYKERKYQTW